MNSTRQPIAIELLCTTLPIVKKLTVAERPREGASIQTNN